VVLDSGVLDRADDPALRGRIEGYIARGWSPTIPTVTLAEATGGPHDEKVDRAIGRFGTVTTPVRTARLAGRLYAEPRVVRRRAASTPSWRPTRSMPIGRSC
jgi:hypothetical protein